MTAYYNEFDEYAAEWLRNLIAAGHIAPGVVDTRSIEDVHPDELRDFAQCHFFAGIGVWSYALRRAGWADDRPVWTGSCPCQPFSAAGQGAGFADERHLWPHFFHLIGERRPPIVIGEQVASKDADPWIDLVQDDLEGVGYRVGAVPFPSAGVGAPHIRDRLYWVGVGQADANHKGLEGRQLPAKRAAQRAAGQGGMARGLAHTANNGQQRGRPGEAGDGRDAARIEPERLCDVGGLADADGRDAGAERQQRGGEQRQQPKDGGRGGLAPVWVADDARGGRREERLDAGRGAVGDRAKGFATGSIDGCGDLRTGPTNGYWRDADWLGCRDGKFRPVEPGTFPLAHGATARVGRLRAYGNAINASAAEVFIRCVMECQP